MDNETKTEAERELDATALQIFHSIYAYERDTWNAKEIAAKARKAAAALLGREEPSPEAVNAFGRAFEAAGRSTADESPIEGDGRSLIIRINDSVLLEYRTGAPGGFWIEEGKDADSVRVEERDFSPLMQGIQSVMNMMRECEMLYRNPPGQGVGSYQGLRR